MINVVDTHALTRYISDHSSLGAAGRAIFDDPTAVLVLLTIALAEARFMIFKNKVGILWRDIIDLIERDGRFVPAELTLDVIDRVPDSLEMHDAIIAATAVLLGEASEEDVRVITRDRRIRDSGLVDTIW